MILQRMTTLLVAMLLVSVALLAACSTRLRGSNEEDHIRTPSSSAMGVLRGHLYVIGGPAPGIKKAISGVASISGKNFRKDVAINDDGAYSVSLSPGEYTVEGHSPKVTQNGREVTFSSDAVTIASGRQVTLDLECHVD
jgi:hypothetical protein